MHRAGDRSISFTTEKEKEYEYAMYYMELPKPGCTVVKENTSSELLEHPPY